MSDPGLVYLPYVADAQNTTWLSIGVRVVDGVPKLQITQNHDDSDVTSIGWFHEFGVHKGNGYQLKRSILGVGNGDKVGFVFLTPPADMPQLHIDFSITGTAESTVCLYRGIEGTPGNEITDIFFKNENSTVTRLTEFYEIGSVTGLVCIDPASFGESFKVGGEDRGNEWVMLPETWYFYEITCDSATGANYLHWSLCYEKLAD